MERVFFTENEEETKILGAALGPLLFPGAVILLSGELGAGKTVFARGVGSGLGVQTPITSPTFTLLNAHQGLLPFYHFDLYRLDDEEELFELGLEELLTGEGVCLLEWAEKFPSLYIGPQLSVTIEQEDFTRRRIVFSSWSEDYKELVQALAFGR